MKRKRNFQSVFRSFLLERQTYKKTKQACLQGVFFVNLLDNKYCIRY
jgi:glycerol-3-phosphate responsive antiterminator